MIVISRDILYTKAHHDRFCIHIRIRSLIAKILLQKRNSRCTYVITMLYWKLIRCRYVPLDHLWSTSILSYQTWPNLNAFRLTSETKTSKVLTLLSVKPTCFRRVIRRWPRRDYWSVLSRIGWESLSRVQSRMTFDTCLRKRASIDGSLYFVILEWLSISLFYRRLTNFRVWDRDNCHNLSLTKTKLRRGRSRLDSSCCKKCFIIEYKDCMNQVQISYNYCSNVKKKNLLNRSAEVLRFSISVLRFSRLVRNDK